MKGKTLVLKTSDIQAGVQYFQFFSAPGSIDSDPGALTFSR